MGGALTEAIATACEIKKSVASKALATLAEVGTAEVKKSGVFTIPGLCRIKTRRKPATKAGQDRRQGLRGRSAEEGSLKRCVRAISSGRCGTAAAPLSASPSLPRICFVHVQTWA